MDKNKQKIAIAEHCGWKYLPKDSYGIQWVTPPKGTPPKKHVPSAPFAPSDVPDYTQDLNAMHEAEKVLNQQQRKKSGASSCYQENPQKVRFERIVICSKLFDPCSENQGYSRPL